jgi:predicted O-methyltransferase YrrM
MPMNAVLEKMLRTKLADGESPQFPLHSNMSREEGKLIDRVFRTVAPDVSVEVGCAYGVSTLYVCDALAANGKAAKHIVIDPFQRQYWCGIGLTNIAKAGYDRFIEFLHERSEIALPALVAAGTRVQAAIIDGNHRFDHALVDFFYVNKMLVVGGVVILDDTDFPSVSRLVEHISTYPAYEVFAVVGQPGTAATTMRTKLRRALARRTLSPKLHNKRDYPTCMAFRKIAEDERRWDWHVDF